MSRAIGIGVVGGAPPFAGPFPERRKPIHGGSGRDVLSRTVRKGPGKFRRTAQQADAFALDWASTGRRGLLGRLLRTESGDPGAVSQRTRKTCTPRAVCGVNTSYRDRARQDVAPGGSMDGFTPFAIRRIDPADRAQIATLVLSELTHRK